MATRARSAGVVTAVGLQGRHDPSLSYIRQLHAEGWFGRIVAVNVTMMGGGALVHPSADAWMGVKANGANFMTIVGGHTIDAISFCLNPFTELSALVATQMPSCQTGVRSGDVPPAPHRQPLIRAAGCVPVEMRQGWRCTEGVVSQYQTTGRSTDGRPTTERGIAA